MEVYMFRVTLLIVLALLLAACGSAAAGNPAEKPAVDGAPFPVVDVYKSPT